MQIHCNVVIYKRYLQHLLAWILLWRCMKMDS